MFQLSPFFTVVDQNSAAFGEKIKSLIFWVKTKRNIGIMPGHRHNAGSLKQKNKAHGSTHSSKRSLKRAQGGKVNAQPGPANVGGVVSGTTINGMHTG